MRSKYLQLAMRCSLAIVILSSCRAGMSDSLASLTRLKTRMVAPQVTRVLPMPGSAGLSQARVSQIVQDQQGFLWMGTQFGLNRFDGTNVRQFLPGHGASGLGCSYINSLLADHNGNLWISCDHTFEKLDLKTEVFTPYPLPVILNAKGLPSVRSIFEDHQGIVWLSTSEGMVRLDPLSGSATVYGNNPSDPSTLSQSDVKTVYEDRENRLWVATRTSLDLFDRGAGKVLRHIPTALSHEGTFCYEDRKGVFWIVIDGNVETLDVPTGAITPVTSFGLGDHEGLGSIRSLIEDNAGGIWIGTEKAGVIHVYPNRDGSESYSYIPGQRNNLTSSRVTSLFQDSRGDIWVALHDAPPNLITNSGLNFESYKFNPNDRNGLRSPLVTTIFEVTPGYLLVGSTGALQLLNESTGLFSPIEGTSRDVLDILRDNRQRLWFAGSNGVLRFDPVTGQKKLFGDKDFPLGNAVIRLLQDRKHRIWAATWDGLDLYDPVADTFHNVFYIQNESYLTIEEGPDGSIWLGSNMGIERYDPETRHVDAIRNVSGVTGLSSLRINAILFGQDNKVWVGTQNGLDLLDSRTHIIKHLGEDDSRVGGVISCMLQDGHGSIWMSTNQGIVRFDPLTRNIDSFDVADGLPGQDLSGWGTCMKGSHGEMFFGGFSGAVSFWPDHIKLDGYKPSLALTFLNLNGKPAHIGPEGPLSSSISYARSVSLPYHLNSVLFGFSLLDLRGPKPGQIRYRLDSLDQGWNYVNPQQQSASYGDLAPGKYDFRVQSLTGHSLWGSELTFQLTVLPPWWASWYMRLTYIVAIVVSSYAIYQIRMRQMRSIFRARAEERANERIKMAREMHDTLLQGLQALLLRVSVAASRFSPTDPGRIDLDVTLTHAEHALSEGRDALQGLRPLDLTWVDIPRELEDCAEKLGGDSAAVLSIQISGAVPANCSVPVDQILRIAQEAIRNAFKHGEARNIRVELNCDASQITLTVQDDGVGIPGVVLAQGMRNHWGLTGMRERAEEAGGTFQIDSEQGHGTLLTAIFPLPPDTRFRRRIGLAWGRFTRFTVDGSSR